MTFHSHWRRDRVFWLICALAAILGVIYNFVILLGYAPDEPRHMNYVALLLDEHRLPFLLPGGGEYRGAHTLHPPLYYSVLVPFLMVGRLFGEGGWHLVRLVSLAICLAALPLFYDVAYRVSQQRGVARLAVAQLALLPIFGMTAGSINNDSSSLLAFAAFLWLLVVRFDNNFSPRAALWLGAALGLGSLCKATVVIADMGALLAYFFWRRGEVGARTWVARLPIGMLGAAVFALPWYARNYALYGKFAPIESGYTNPALPDPSHGILVMMMHDNFPPLFVIANQSLFDTLWSQKDWFPETIRSGIYGVLGIFCLLATLGNGMGWWRERKIESASPTEAVPNAGARAGRGAAYTAFALSWAACLWMALFRHWGWAEGGRYLLAALFGFSLFVALGWQNCVGVSRLKIVTAVWCVLALGLNGVAIYWLLSYLNPTFGPH